MVLTSGVRSFAGDVIINEFMAASSERRLTWDAGGTPRLGSGARWVDLEYDASSWSNGLVPAGYAFAGLAMDLTSQMKDKTPSLYIRKEFQATSEQAGSTNALVLSIQYNDGFVAYLNGREVARANCGGTNHFMFVGEPAWNVSTTSNVVDFTVGPAVGRLVAGKNVLAIQAHNAEQPSTASSPEQITRHLPTPEFRINAGLRLAEAAPVDLVPMGTAGGIWKYHVGRAEPSGGVVDLGLVLKTFTPPVGEEDDYDQPAAFSDWVELHNTGPGPVNIGGWSLTDDMAAVAKWRFPTNTTIAAGGFLVVLCDNRDEANAPAGPANRLHTNFKLNQDGGTLLLFDNSGQFVDGLMSEYPAQVSFCSYGRKPQNPLEFAFLSWATPGRTNSGNSFLARVPPVKFLDSSGLEQPGGIYSGSSLTVVLSNDLPGATILYTVNGMEPTESTGSFYSQPLVLAQSNEKVGKVIRARAFYPGWLPSKTKTATYLLRQPAALTNLPVMLFTGDPVRDWYAPDGLLSIVGGSYLATGNGSVWQAGGPHTYNFVLGSGSPVEREMHLEYYFPQTYYPTGQAPFRMDVGLRVSASGYSRPRMTLTGAATASPWDPKDPFRKPSFNLYFGGEFGPGSLDYALYTNYTVRNFKHLRLRAGKNDIHNPFITDELVRRLWLDLGHIGSLGFFCSLYVNGTYKGLYNPCERYREQFFQEHLRSQADWDVYYSWDWVDGDRTAFTQLLTALDQNLTNLTNWRSVTNKLQVDNAADYYLLNIYCATWDWPGNNFIIARERSLGPEGRFRFAVWDAEGAFNAIGYAKSVTYNTITQDLIVPSGNQYYWVDVSRIFRRLATSPEFRLRFADRINRHMFNGGVLDDRDPDGAGPLRSRFSQRLLELSQELSAAIQYNSGTALNLSAFNGWTASSTGRRSYLLGTAAGRRMFRDSGFWPLTEPPAFNQHGGPVPEGFRLSMTSTVATSGQTATIYYTLDGRDPRVQGGGLDPVAVAYSAPVPVTQVVTVKARARNNTTSEWSPLTEATFAPAAVPASPENLVIAEIMYHPGDVTPPEQSAGFSNADDFEFIRLQNIGGVPIDLGMVRLADGVTFDFGSGSVRYLNPGANLLVVADQRAFQQRYGGICNGAVAGQFTGNLANNGERLLLAGASDAIVREVWYGDAWPWPAAADGGGVSLLLANPSSNPDHSDPSSWTVTACPGGMPCGVAPQLTYAGWRLLFFEGANTTNNLVSGPAADPDGDGLSNFVEYALALDPHTWTEPPRVVPSIDYIADERHLVAAIRVAVGATEARLTWQTSTDLSAWSPAGETVQILEQLPLADGSALWRYAYMPALPDAPGVFLRLQVSGW